MFCKIIRACYNQSKALTYIDAGGRFGLKCSKNIMFDTHLKRFNLTCAIMKI